MAFKIAASLAFKKGMEAAKPILLEPIMKYEISIPEAVSYTHLKRIKFVV